VFQSLSIEQKQRLAAIERSGAADTASRARRTGPGAAADERKASVDVLLSSAAPDTGGSSYWASIM